MKSFNLIYLSLFFLACVVFITACNRQLEEELEIEDSPKIRELVSMGFKREDIVDIGDYFLVDGCYVVPKNEEALNSSETDIGQRSIGEQKSQYWNGNRVWHADNLVRIHIDSSIPASGQNNWRNAIQSAVDEYNGFPGGLNLSLQIVNSAENSDIVIRRATSNLNLGSGTYAAAALPSNGKVGNSIFINFEFGNGVFVAESDKIHIMVHELGHCFGLRHTDWVNDSGQSGNYVHIPNTPSSPNGDMASVMMSTHAQGTGWNGFSMFDQTAFRYLFPNYSLQVSGTSNIQETPTLLPGQVYTISLNGIISNATYNWSTSSFQMQIISGQGQSAIDIHTGPTPASDLEVLVTLEISTPSGYRQVTRVFIIKGSGGGSGGPGNPGGPGFPPPETGT